MPQVPPSQKHALRHCPACGVAMVASKSHGSERPADLFECLHCGTVIEVRNHRGTAPPE